MEQFPNRRIALPGAAAERVRQLLGGEIYFDVPVRTSSEPDAADVVEPGTVAYWPAGPCLCVFWGPTPASVGEECRTASAVNIVGRVLNPEVLPQLTGRAVRVEAAG